MKNNWVICFLKSYLYLFLWIVIPANLCKWSKIEPLFCRLLFMIAYVNATPELLWPFCDAVTQRGFPGRSIPKSFRKSSEMWFFWKIRKYVDRFFLFLSAMSLPRTSKDLNSCLPSFSIETKSWQKHQSLSDSSNLADFNNVNKEFIPRKSSQKILPKKNPPKIFLQKNPRKIKKSPQNPEKIQKISKQFLKKFLILKISNSLHRTWRPKTLCFYCNSSIFTNKFQ